MKTYRISFKFLLSVVGLFSLTLFSCSPRAYVVNDIDKELGKNPTIAVLPYQITFNGKLPKGLSEEQRAKQDNEEKIAFQQSLFSYLSGKLRKEPVKILPIQQTNAKLNDLGYDIYKIAQYPAQDLAKALGVDAVITPSMEKFRYRSDEASFAIDAASTILRTTTSLPMPYGVSSTNDVKANCALVSAKNGTLLWNVTRIGKANWNYQVNNVMDDLHRRMARKIPSFTSKK